MRIVNLEGFRFGRLLVLDRGKAQICGGRSRTTWQCRCDCGSDVTVVTDNLRSGNSTSCGCTQRGQKPESNPQQADSIVAEYVSGHGFPYIAAMHGVSPTRVCGVLKRAGIPLRSYVEANRKYTCDHQFFDAINTESKAYWLGFIAADGCVTSNKLQVIIADADRPHLEKLRNSLESTHPVHTYSTSGGFVPHSVANFSIRSDALVAGLMKHGVTPRKSLTGEPAILASELQHHYWRGLFDGDGFICTSTYRGASRWEAGIVGSKLIVKGFADFIGPKIGSIAAARPTKNMWIYKVSAKKVGPIFDILYDGATVYLERKHLKFKDELAERAA